MLLAVKSEQNPASNFIMCCRRTSVIRSFVSHSLTVLGAIRADSVRPDIARSLWRHTACAENGHPTGTGYDRTSTTHLVPPARPLQKPVDCRGAAGEYALFGHGFHSRARRQLSSHRLGFNTNGTIRRITRKEIMGGAPGQFASVAAHAVRRKRTIT